MVMAKITGLFPRMFLVAAFLSLSACDMYAPPQIVNTKTQLVPGEYAREYTTANLSGTTLAALAGDYLRFGDGTMEMMIAYDPRDPANNARRAAQHAERIADGLRHEGVVAPIIETMPVKGLGARSITYVNYRKVEASAPESCVETMPGMDHRDVKPMSKDYQYGCTVETLVARQISRPGDLRGREGIGGGDGRRGAALQEGVRSGAPMPSLPAASSSF